MPKRPALRWPALLRYGVLGIPLAFAGLPIYVHVPKFYAQALGVNLGLLGSVLLFIRLFDTVLDPIIGVVSDRLHRYFRIIMAACVPLLITGYALLFNPPDWATPHALLWLTFCLGLVYISFSTLMINYYALGVEMADSYNDQTRVAAFREGSMLVGVLLASLVPPLLLSHYGLREAYSLFSLLLIPLLITCAAIVLSAAPPRREPKAATENASTFLQLLKSSDVRWVLFVGFCNAIPSAITSTLFMFFTAEVLHASDNDSGIMLAVYFLSAAFGMPLWTYLSRKYRKKHSLLIAQIVAIICFIWAWKLGAGDILPFYIICILSGLTLGADQALLPSMLGDVLATQREATATGFGLWNLTSKLTMALAAGIVLPLLEGAGFHPGMENSQSALAGLSLCYALLPCLFKAIAAGTLYISPIDRQRRTS